MDFDAEDLQSLDTYLKLNKISKEDICLVGSTTLSLIGIRNHNDIDIVIHSRNNNIELSKHQLIEQVNNPWSTLFSDDELIENSNLHSLYNGFKFVVPELIYHKKVWHNRLKDQSDIIELNEYAKMHNNWDWSLVNDYLPNPSLFKVALKKIKTRINLYNNRIRDYFRYDSSLHCDGFQMIPIASLLEKQVVNNTFNRYDLIVRYMAIESFFNKNEKGRALYNKMQVNRRGSSFKNPWKVFKELIVSVNNDGLDASFPILVNSDFYIVDGAHRLACALYFNEKYIAVKVNKKLNPSPYGIDWFKNNDFSTTELEMLHQKKNKIFSDNHLFFEIVLWPPISQYFDEIEKFISEKYKIISSDDHNDIPQFTSYIKELYKIDDIKDWKVDLKIEGMSSCPKDIRILKIEIPEPEFRKKENGQLISKKVELLKKEIRESYKGKVDNYFHDIIIHIGDNYSHSKQSKNLLK